MKPTPGNIEWRGRVERAVSEWMTRGLTRQQALAHVIEQMARKSEPKAKASPPRA